MKEYQVIKNGTEQGTLRANSIKEARGIVFATYGEHREVVLIKPKKLFKTDYVIYDKANDNPLQDSYGRIILFGDINEALNDCRGNESVIPCTDLPKHWQVELLNQININ
jgi:hypothetical protein